MVPFTRDISEWESFFFFNHIRGVSNVVLSNDKKEKKERKREAARFKGWQVTKSGV